MGTPENGGARRDRTVDLLHAMQALSQLSYGPIAEGPNCPGGGTYCQRLGGFTPSQGTTTWGLYPIPGDAHPANTAALSVARRRNPASDVIAGSPRTADSACALA